MEIQLRDLLPGHKRRRERDSLFFAHTDRKQDRGTGKLKNPKGFCSSGKEKLGTGPCACLNIRILQKRLFMQDVQARTIYEGLKGRNGRNNLLEEFLVALHVKEAVSLRTDREKILLNAPETITEGVIGLTASGWGYVKIQVEADGDFLAVEKNAVTTREFDQGNCQIHYQILPQYLHVGRNFGSVRIRSLRQEFVFPVEVIKKNVQGADGREKKTADKASVCEFSRLRLKQEFTDEGDFSVNSGLLKKTENLRARYPEDIAVRLWRTEQLLKQEEKMRIQRLLQRSEILF